MLELACRKFLFLLLCLPALVRACSLIPPYAPDVAWTSFGWRTTVPGTPLDACPGGTAGVYHANEDPNAYMVNTALVAGCALAIANGAPPESFVAT